MFAPRALGHAAKGTLSAAGKAAKAPLAVPLIPIPDSYHQAA